jgi:hypothetical protein
MRYGFKGVNVMIGARIDFLAVTNKRGDPDPKIRLSYDNKYLLCILSRLMILVSEDPNK